MKLKNTTHQPLIYNQVVTDYLTGHLKISYNKNGEEFYDKDFDDKAKWLQIESSVKDAERNQMYQHLKDEFESIKINGIEANESKQLIKNTLNEKLLNSLYIAFRHLPIEYSVQKESYHSAKIVEEDLRWKFFKMIMKNKEDAKISPDFWTPRQNLLRANPDIYKIIRRAIINQFYNEEERTFHYDGQVYFTKKSEGPKEKASRINDRDIDKNLITPMMVKLQLLLQAFKYKLHEKKRDKIIFRFWDVDQVNDIILKLFKCIEKEYPFMKIPTGVGSNILNYRMALKNKANEIFLTKETEQLELPENLKLIMAS